MLTNKEKLTAQAQKFVEKGQYERAIREYLKVVAEDEKDVRTWLKIGDLFVKLGHKAQAAQTYQKVARFYADQGFYLKSVAVYKQILKIDPRLIDVNLALAELYQQLGLPQDAISQYEAVASFLQREGRARDAVAAHRAALDLDPDNVAQRIKLAELYSKVEMPQEAAREFRRTAEQLRALGRQEDFLKVGERLLFHDPEDREMARELALAYLQRGDARRALTKLQLLFKADPCDAGTLELLARAFLALGQHQKCVSVLKELGRLHLEAGRRDEGLATYRQILELDPQDGDARAVLSASQPAMIALASPPPAQVPAAEAEASPPPVTDEEVARTLTEADVYAKYGLYQKSIEHLRRALERQPHNRLVRERLYGLYEAAGQPEAAVAELWAIAAQAQTLEEAASCLSEILRIDPQNKAAINRWHELRAGRRSGGESPAGELQDELDEVEFFLRQSMHAEARQLLQGLQQRFPDSEVIRRKLQALPPAGEAATEEPGAEAVGGPAYELTRRGLREKGVTRSAASSYFELGLAYRDMGLYADAIAELRKAMQDRKREVQCRTLIGLCLLEQDLFLEAAAELRQALQTPGATDEQLSEIYYHLGRAYEQLSDRAESLRFYELVLERDRNYRDAQERVAYLQALSEPATG